MRIALISDLHGNRPAVKALEDNLKHRHVDETWCLGDLVGKGPDSDFTFDWAMANCSLILGGNWDYGIGRQEFKRDSFYHRQLGSERMRKLAQLPTEHQLLLSGRKIRFIHGRPVMEKIRYIQDSKELLLPYLAPDYDALIYADCHRQGARTIKGQVYNIGSVGNALGVPLVQYAILSGEPGAKPSAMEVSFITLPYDNAAAAEDARKSDGLPDADAYIKEVTTGEYAGDLRFKTIKPA